MSDEELLTAMAREVLLNNRAVLKQSATFTPPAQERYARAWAQVQLMRKFWHNFNALRAMYRANAQNNGLFDLEDKLSAIYEKLRALGFEQTYGQLACPLLAALQGGDKHGDN